MIRPIAILVFLFGSSLSWAQAGSDCGEQSRLAVQSCQGRIVSAKQSDVSGFSGAGLNGGGSAQAQAAYAIRARIGQEISNCEQRDRQICLDQCNAALRDAQAKQNVALQQSIKRNVGTCSDRIDLEIANAQAAQNSLTTAAADSNTSSGAGCAEGETCGVQDPNIQQANSPCPAGMFWSVRFNQCTGIGAFTPRDMIPTPFRAK